MKRDLISLQDATLTPIEPPARKTWLARAAWLGSDPALARDPAFRDYLQQLSRPIVLTAAWLSLVMLPMLTWLEWQVDGSDQLWWTRLMMRVPLLLVVVAIIVTGRMRPDARWAQAAGFGLALLLMSAGWLMFVLHAGLGGGSRHGVSHLMTMLVPAVAILATRGLRDIVLIYLLPLLLSLPTLALIGVQADAELGYYVYPLLGMPIGVVISQILYRGYVQAFVARRSLEQSARTDSLTGLLNRRAMDDLLRAAHARARRQRRSYAVIMADLDHFKQINDRFGHAAGDEVLRTMGRLLLESVRADDQVARWGGEEFMVLLQDTDASVARAVAEKIRALISDEIFDTGEARIAVTISLGVALSRDEPRFDDVVVRADQALYLAKEGGRNCTMLAE